MWTLLSGEAASTRPGSQDVTRKRSQPDGKRRLGRNRSDPRGEAAHEPTEVPQLVNTNCFQAIGGWPIGVPGPVVEPLLMLRQGTDRSAVPDGSIISHAKELDISGGFRFYLNRDESSLAWSSYKAHRKVDASAFLCSRLSEMRDLTQS